MQIFPGPTTEVEQAAMIAAAREVEPKLKAAIPVEFRYTSSMEHSVAANIKFACDDGELLTVEVISGSHVDKRVVAREQQ